MCNYCVCKDSDKCSVKFGAPVGWCCEQCEKYDPLVICPTRFPESLASLIKAGKVKRSRTFDIAKEDVKAGNKVGTQV
ncbi:MAG: hypothetical protein ACTSRG_12315 [Candidatus Helarchaeota archaeon]